MIRHTTIFVLSAVIAVTLIAGCGSTSDHDNDPTTSLAPAQQWDPDGDAPTESSTSAPAQPTAPTAQTTLPADAQSVDRHDAAAVATTAVRIWFTWNTGTDQGPLDAVARTAPLLTASFRDASLSSSAISPGGTWLRWASDNAVVTPTITAQPNQGAPDSSDRKYFIFDVTQTGRDARGDQSGASVHRTVWVICTRSNGAWEVSQLAEQE